MKNIKNTSTLYDLKVKYKLIAPVKSVEEEANKRMKKIYKNILRKTGTYSLWFSIVMSFMMLLKKFGFATVNFYQSTVIFIVISTTGILTVSGGTYYVVKHTIESKTDKKQIEENVFPEPEKSSEIIESSKADNSKVITNNKPIKKINTTKKIFIPDQVIAIDKIKNLDVSKNIANKVIKSLQNNISQALGKNKALPLKTIAINKENSKIIKIIEGAVIKGNNQYIIQIRMTNTNYRVELNIKEQINSLSNSNINEACKKLSKRIANAL